MTLNPQAVGEFLLNHPLRKREGLTLSEIADSIPWGQIQPMTQRTLGMDTAERYQEELHMRMVLGDKYAASLLRGEEWNEPS